MEQVEQGIKEKLGRADQVTGIRRIDGDPGFAAMVVVGGIDDTAAILVSSASDRG